MTEVIAKKGFSHSGKSYRRGERFQTTEKTAEALVTSGLAEMGMPTIRPLEQAIGLPPSASPVAPVLPKQMPNVSAEGVKRGRRKKESLSSSTPVGE